MKAISTLLAAALGAAIVASPASAEQTRRVTYHDLNLTTAEGQAALQKRLDRAAWQVCLSNDAGTPGSAQIHNSCYREARKQVAVSFAAIVADSQRGG